MLIRTKKRAVAKQASVAAPIGGLNGKDAIAAMAITDAVILENWFPEPSDVTLRDGSLAWATGMAAAVESIFSYRAATSPKRFAVAGTSVFDVTATGAVGAAVVTGLTNARFQYTNMANAGGQHLYAVNGVDKPLYYNGTAWTKVDAVSTPAITGVTTTSLVHVNLFKNRLFFVEKDSFRVWYLDTYAIAGAASSIDFGALFKLGGSLMAMATWTLDNADGVDDYAVFITTEGEVAVYQGTDPSSAATWSLSGVFRVGRPIGRRCFTKIGSDVGLILTDGIYPLSKALLTDRSQTQAITDKIVNLVSEAIQSYGSNFGWQLTLHPYGRKLIINVPKTEGVQAFQYVMNTITGAWCKFTGWNANCMEVDGDQLFYGGLGTLYQADVGGADAGINISCDALQAFSYFGLPGRSKRFTMIRPIITADASIRPAIAINLDYQPTLPTSMPTFTQASTSRWNVSPWNTTPWGRSARVQKNWQTVSGVGFAAALRILVQSNTTKVRWQATDFVFELGGVL